MLEELFEADLSSAELASFAEALDELHGLGELAERLLVKALERQAQRGTNPDINPIWITSDISVILFSVID